jgi:hypothetical protein
MGTTTKRTAEQPASGIHSSVAEADPPAGLLRRAKEALRLRPYDLVVVKRQKVDAEYFTVSATGVMRIRKGVQAEFTPLAEWVREKTLFDLLSSISFFKNYLIGKCFRKWHQVGGPGGAMQGSGTR